MTCEKYKTEHEQGYVQSSLDLILNEYFQPEGQKSSNLFFIHKESLKLHAW